MKYKFLFVFTLASLVYTNNGAPIQCKHVQFRASRIRSYPDGYCWYFIPGNHTIEAAQEWCNYFDGSLPVVNTETKAKLLAKFAADSRNLYSSGQFSKNWVEKFTGSWQADDIWLSSMEPSGGGMLWDETKTPVTSKSQAPSGQPKMRYGKACAKFNAVTATSTYISCDDRFSMVCEERGHPDPEAEELLDDDEDEYYSDGDNNSDDKTKASRNGRLNGVGRGISPALLSGMYKDWLQRGIQIIYSSFGFLLGCPKGFTLFEGSCLKLAPGNGSFVQWAGWFCRHNGGDLVQINSKQKQDTVIKYIKENLKIGHGIWMDQVYLKGKSWVWKTDDADASYIKAALKQLQHRTRTRPIFLSRPQLDGGKISECPVMIRNCLRVALCEAQPGSEEEHTGVDDYYNF